MKGMCLFAKMLLLINVLNVAACNPIDEKMEKDKIYVVLQQLDSFYQSDGYIINKSSYPPFDWTVSTSAIVKNYGKIDLADNNVMYLTKQKLKVLEGLKLCSSKYLSELNTRVSNNKALSLGTLLVNHAYSNFISALLAQKSSFDYYPPNSNPDGPTDSILLKNESLSAAEVDAWHKRHINLTDDNHAIYKVMYTEVGLSVNDRANAFFNVALVKEDNGWKIDDISIKEVSESEMLAFWKKSMGSRK